MRILVDVDGVCAETVKHWLGRYNADWNDNVQEEDILEWGIYKYVKCTKDELFTYLTLPDFYKGVPMVFGALQSILKLRKAGHTILYVTHGIHIQKAIWLQQNGFLLSSFTDPAYAKDIVVTGDKSLVKGDVLIDDNFENLQGHTGILFDRPWNRNDDAQYRAKDWAGVLNIIAEMEAKNE